MSKFRELFSRWEKTALAIVAFLVVIPSIINAIGDIWSAVRGLPIGKQQKINAALFQTHFRDTPAASQQIKIESDFGSLIMSLDVYSNGDILVDYGKFTQWFPFYHDKLFATNFHLINTANAEDGSWLFKNSADIGAAEADGDIESLRVKAETQKIEHKDLSSTELERKRTLTDGSVETLVINKNTGEIVKIDHTITQDPPTPVQDNEPEREDSSHFYTHVIDVRSDKLQHSLSSDELVEDSLFIHVESDTIHVDKENNQPANNAGTED